MRKICCVIFIICILNSLVINNYAKAFSGLNSNMEQLISVNDLNAKGMNSHPISNSIPIKYTNDTIVTYDMPLNANDGYGQTISTVFVLTNDSTQVTALKKTDWSVAYGELYHYTEIAQNFEEITLDKVRDYPTYAYNGHSYAWYERSIHNQLWIENDQVQKFIDDDHTDEINNPNDYKTNDIITYWRVGYNTDGVIDYLECLHSGVIETFTSDGTIVCVSKWDEYGLYVHNYNYVPADYATPVLNSEGEIEYRVFTRVFRYIPNVHDLYLYVDNGEDGCIVKCRDCEHTIDCPEAAEYDPAGASGHYVGCPSGEFSFLAEHNNDCTIIMNNLYYHQAVCLDCGYSYQESHTWQTVIGGYVCSDCGMTATIVPGEVMSLTDEELEALLATLSEDEVAALIAGLDPEARNRVTSVLTPHEDDLVTE